MNNKPTGERKSECCNKRLAIYYVDGKKACYKCRACGRNYEYLHHTTPPQPKADTKIEYTYPSDGRVLINGVPYVKEPKADTEPDVAWKVAVPAYQTIQTKDAFIYNPHHRHLIVTARFASPKNQDTGCCSYCGYEEQRGVENKKVKYCSLPGCRFCHAKNQDISYYTIGETLEAENQDTQAEGVEERVKMFWTQHYDGPLGYLTLQGLFEAFLKQEIAAAEEIAEEKHKEIAAKVIEARVAAAEERLIVEVVDDIITAVQKNPDWKREEIMGYLMGLRSFNKEFYE